MINLINYLILKVIFFILYNIIESFYNYLYIKKLCKTNCIDIILNRFEHKSCELLINTCKFINLTNECIFQ